VTPLDLHPSDFAEPESLEQTAEGALVRRELIDRGILAVPGGLGAAASGQAEADEIRALLDHRTGDGGPLVEPQLDRDQLLPPLVGRRLGGAVREGRGGTEGNGDELGVVLASLGIEAPLGEECDRRPIRVSRGRARRVGALLQGVEAGQELRPPSESVASADME
jgi:hypothetical protein